MIKSPGKSGNSGSASNAGSVRSAGRRRLLQTSISAAPVVVMTVASRPVLAGFCQSPSGFVSGNLSGPQGATCSGLGPDKWKIPSLHSWPPGYYAYDEPGHAATQFCAVFNTAPCGPYSGKTLQDVLLTPAPTNIGTADQDQVARYCIAAVFNTLLGLVPASILPVPTILEIWRQYITTGVYTPGNGVFWSNIDIVNYLSTTMTP